MIRFIDSNDFFEQNIMALTKDFLITLDQESLLRSDF